MSAETKTSNTGGISILGIVGAGLAAYCSWTLWQSPIWAGLHALCGWFYLLYLCAGCGGGLPPEFWGAP